MPPRLPPPPAQTIFNELPLDSMTRTVEGTFYRLHTLNPQTHAPFKPVYFSTDDNSRFNPKGGAGTLYLAAGLVGALMEIFNDRWGAIGGLRFLTAQQREEWWVTLVNFPTVKVLDLTGPNLSKLGVDAQLTCAADYKHSREWAHRVMDHPCGLGGILYRSRHDPERLNVALFKRPGLSPARLDPRLNAAGMAKWVRRPADKRKLVYGPTVLLNDHQDLAAAAAELVLDFCP